MSFHILHIRMVVHLCGFSKHKFYLCLLGEIYLMLHQAAVWIKHFPAKIAFMLWNTGMDEHMLPKLSARSTCMATFGTNMISYLFMNTFLFWNFKCSGMSKLPSHFMPSKAWSCPPMGDNYTGKRFVKKSKYHASWSLRFFLLVNGRPPSPLLQSAKRQYQAVFSIPVFLSRTKSSSTCNGSNVDSISISE